MIRRAAAWLLARLLPGPRVHPEFLAAGDRARLERLTGRKLGPCVPVDFDWRAMAWEARFAEILDGPEGDVEEAFLVMVTGWFRDDSGSAA